MSNPEQAASRAGGRDPALAAITAALTASETARILEEFAFPGSVLHGAGVDDVLDMAEANGSFRDKTEPFYAHHGKLPDMPGLRFAVVALCLLDRTLTVSGVKDLLARAGLLAAS